MLVLNLNVSKLEKEFFWGDEGKQFADVMLFRTPDSEYGDAYVVTQSISREAREAGRKGPILGNARFFGRADEALAERLSGSISLSAVDKSRLYAGKKGRWLAVAALHPPRGLATEAQFLLYQSVSKEERAMGKVGNQLGALHLVISEAHTPAAAAVENPASAADSVTPGAFDDDDIPF